MNEKSIDDIIVEVGSKSIRFNQTIKQLYDNQPKNIDWILCKCDRRIHRSEWKTHWIKCYTIIHTKN